MVTVTREVTWMVTCGRRRIRKSCHRSGASCWRSSGTARGKGGVAWSRERQHPGRDRDRRTGRNRVTRTSAEEEPGPMTTGKSAESAKREDDKLIEPEGTPG
eukprot:3417171-Rhodomonas_salina.2